MAGTDDICIYDDWEAATVDWDTITTVGVVPSPSELVTQLDERAIGHQHVKEALAEGLRIHLMRNEGVDPSPRLLLMGPRGFGKTTLADAMLASTDQPAIRVDCSDLTLLRDPSSIAPGSVLFLDGIERLQPEDLTLLDDLDARLLVTGAVTIAEHLPQDATQDELRRALTDAMPNIPELAACFDRLVPLARLTAAEVAMTFALPESSFARARRVIISLGGNFEIDPKSVESLAKASAEGPVGVWWASLVIDRLLELVLLSPDPARTWRLRDVEN